MTGFRHSTKVRTNKQTKEQKNKRTNKQKNNQANNIKVRSTNGQTFQKHPELTQCLWIKPHLNFNSIFQEYLMCSHCFHHFLAFSFPLLVLTREATIYYVINTVDMSKKIFMDLPNTSKDFNDSGQAALSLAPNMRFIAVFVRSRNSFRDHIDCLA